LDAEHTKLSKREKEVLVLIARELTTRQIAKKLFLSMDTVQSHRRSLKHKLEVKNTAGLIVKAIYFNYLRFGHEGEIYPSETCDE